MLRGLKKANALAGIRKLLDNTINFFFQNSQIGRGGDYQTNSS